MNKTREINEALAAKNRTTAKWLCGGMFALYNGFFGAMTAINPNPPEAASKAFNYMGGNCLGITAPVASQSGPEMWAPLRAATCVLTMAGAGGTAVGGLFPARTPTTSP